MKNKLLASSILVLSLICAVGIVFYFARIKSRPIVQAMDEKGIFIGENNHMLNKSSSSGSQYQREIQEDDTAHDHIRQGDLLARQGQLAGAAEEYKKAYSIGGISRAVSGTLLAQTYEKLGQYDEASTLLNQMIEKRQLSETGIQDAKAMISRLLAAKQKT